MDAEFGKCDFCGEEKILKRFYVKVRNRHFNDNEKGTYCKFFRYCDECGIIPENIDEQRKSKFEIGQEVFHAYNDFYIWKARIKTISLSKDKIMYELVGDRPTNVLPISELDGIFASLDEAKDYLRMLAKKEYKERLRGIDTITLIKTKI